MSAIEDNMNDEQNSEPILVASEPGDVEPVQASSSNSGRFVTVEEKGLCKVFTVSPGYNVVIVEKNGIKQFIATPESQPLDLPGILSPPPPAPKMTFDPPATSTQVSPVKPMMQPPAPKMAFDPPAASTQISPIKPMMPTFNSPWLHLETSLQQLSMSHDSNLPKDMNQVDLESSRVTLAPEPFQSEPFVPPVHLNPKKPNLSIHMHQVEPENSRERSAYQKLWNTESSSVIEGLMPASQQPGTQQNTFQSEAFVPPVHLNPKNMDIEPAVNDIRQQPEKPVSKMRRDIHRITQQCRIDYPMFFGKSTETVNDSIENDGMEPAGTECESDDSHSQPMLKYKPSK